MTPQETQDWIKNASMVELSKSCIWQTVMECTAHCGWTDRAREGLVKAVQESVIWAIELKQKEAVAAEVKELRTQVDQMNQTCISLLLHEARMEESKELILDLFNQACQVRYDRETNTAYYDHMCLSAYENAQRFLLNEKMIKPEQCERGL